MIGFMKKKPINKENKISCKEGVLGVVAEKAD